MRLFLSSSQRDYKVNSRGELDPAGMSDLEVHEWFAEAIQRHSKGQIEVVVVRGPRESISDEVRRRLFECDAVLCLFTKRSRDDFLEQWTTSPYVVSESGFAMARFGTNGPRRVHAFSEEGVLENFGLAFAKDHFHERFDRNDLEAFDHRVRKFVADLLPNVSAETKPAAFQPIALRKTVTVWRSGWVHVENLYGHHLSSVDSHEQSIEHTVWRISDPLPTVDALLQSRPKNGHGYEFATPFMRFMHIQTDAVQSVRSRIVPLEPSRGGNEQNFKLVFEGLPTTGGMLEYMLVWAYPTAFRHPSDLPAGSLNSTGLRTGHRGRVADATLVVKFERDWAEGDAPRTIEEPPRWFFNSAPRIPDVGNPERYWHSAENWHQSGVMSRQDGRADGLFDVFVWNQSNFEGQVKVVWHPAENYHESPVARTRSASVPTQKPAS